MKRCKWIVSLVLALLMAVAMMPAMAFADNELQTADLAYFTVYTQYGEDESTATVVKEYTEAQLTALATSGKLGFLQKSGNDWRLHATSSYIPLDTLLADAGVTFAAGDTFIVAAPDGFKTTLSFDAIDNGKYFYPATSQTATSLDDAEETGAVLALNNRTAGGASLNISSTAAADLAALTDPADFLGPKRFYVGLSEENYLAGTAAGNRFATDPNSITIKFPASEKFNDVDQGAWYGSSSGIIDYVVDNGLILGTSPTTFEPEANITRGQIATILWRHAGNPVPVTLGGFTDNNDSSAFFYEALSWAKEEGILLGDAGATTARPYSNITREELAVLLQRYAIYDGDTSPYSHTVFFQAKDWRTVSDWATDALGWATTLGIVNGKDLGAAGKFLAPQDTATRAEAAKMIKVLAADVL